LEIVEADLNEIEEADSQAGLRGDVVPLELAAAFSRPKDVLMDRSALLVTDPHDFLKPFNGLNDEQVDWQRPLLLT